MIARSLGVEFAAILRQWLTPDELAEVLSRNAAESNPAICHSHDFCDANMAMLEAWERHGMACPQAGDEAALSLWAEAWADGLKVLKQ